MLIALSVAILMCSYLLGSIPSGLVIVKLTTGKDIRQVESGRTGGTNAMRAAGFWAGLGTAILDMLKSAVCVWLARVLVPGSVWVEILAPVLAIAGHNYSVFLIRRREGGGLRFSGGAGGAPAAGGAFGLWSPSLFFVVPAGAAILFFIGYASIATISIPFVALLVFAFRAWMGVSPWQYVLYALIAEVMLIWTLRPNIRRLFNGTERLVGLRARRRKARSNYSSSSSSESS